MILTRRRALLGLLAAPVIIRTPGLLMPVRPAPARVYGWNVGEWFTVRIGTENRDYQILAIARGNGSIAYGTPAYIDRQIVQHFTFGAEVETMSREEILRAVRRNKAATIEAIQTLRRRPIKNIPLTTTGATNVQEVEAGEAQGARQADGAADAGIVRQASGDSRSTQGNGHRPDARDCGQARA